MNYKTTRLRCKFSQGVNKAIFVAHWIRSLLHLGCLEWLTNSRYTDVLMVQAITKKKSLQTSPSKRFRPIVLIDENNEFSISAVVIFKFMSLRYKNQYCPTGNLPQDCTNNQLEAILIINESFNH